MTHGWHYDVFIKDDADKWVRDETFSDMSFWFYSGEIPDCFEHIRGFQHQRFLNEKTHNYEERTYVYTKDNCQFRRCQDEKWELREKSSFLCGRYQPLPWDLPAIEKHYARFYQSSSDNLVEFIASEANGKVGRVTRMKPGRYVALYYPHLSKDEVREYATKVDVAGEVAFASSADDIERVYTNGPRSCMSYPADDFVSPFHPVRVYGDSDIQIAYLASLSLDNDKFRASARCVVWPAKKRYGRIYGDEDRLSAALEKLGYSEGPMDGARIRLVEHEGCYVVPYIDEALACDVHNDSWLKIATGGEVDCEVTNGLSQQAERNYCYYYEQRTNEEVYWIADRSEHWSESAVSIHATFCHGYDEYFSDSQEFHEIDGLLYSLDYLENHGYLCVKTNQWLLDKDDIVELQDTDETVALSWAMKNAYHDTEEDLFYAEMPEVSEDRLESIWKPAEPRCPETLEMVLEMPNASPGASETILGHTEQQRAA